MSKFSEDLVEALKDIVFDCNWQNVGDISQFESMKCYNLEDEDQDILLIRDNTGKFYAIDSRCSHEGGPLEDGDIEELGEKLLVICPWHSFDFDIRDGSSSTGLKQQTYETRVVNNNLYINTPVTLSLHIQKQFEEQNEELVEKFDKNLLISESGEESLCFWAVKILNTCDPHEKARLTDEVAKKWFSGELTQVGHKNPPDQPSRPENLTIIDPSKIRRGKGGTLASRVALLHSLANIEQWAMDLSWDIIARFSDFKFSNGSNLPKEFFSDFVKVARDESKHFVLLDKRLKELGSHFGALAVHNGLWESATTTKSNFLSRLAIVHMVHEARKNKEKKFASSIFRFLRSLKHSDYPRYFFAGISPVDIIVIWVSNMLSIYYENR
ncbi:hypothetical protein BpHYR1_047217 [Brachionus plicatilis]|uniref:Rieske domain-containing protein n=1 Tax=Brachionus plicatilis TaxID=10195 RepID=A0A3M7T5Q1_BRAPC|nr:hypothetical protein BpHYR1_047217 [Brachionus plicatilis]